MNIHPIESLPAYVLGALPADEMQRIAAHVRRCQCCRAEIAACRYALGLVPHSALAAELPPQAKQCLMRRIAADLQLNAPALFGAAHDLRPRRRS